MKRMTQAPAQPVPLEDASLEQVSAGVDPSNPNVVYVGGSRRFVSDSFYGTGVYKSTDSGRT